MSVHAAQRVGSSPRPLGFLLVVAFHLALVWLVACGLGLRIAIDPPPPPFTAVVINEHRPLIAPLRLPPPTTGLTNPLIVVPPPEFPLPVDESPPDAAISTAAIEAPGGTAVTESRREPVSADPRHPFTQPPYPAASIRFGEEGTVTIELLVGIDGRVRESRVLRSSGFPRLDGAALEEALRKWRLKPATLDDAPVEAWHSVRVSFRLDRR